MIFRVLRIENVRVVGSWAGRAAFAALFFLHQSAPALGQSAYPDPYVFSDFATNIDPVGYYTPGGFPNPWGLAVDVVGNLYVADQGEGTIRRIAPNGTATILAGTPGVRGTRDGPGTSALFWGPEGVAVDAAGNILVGDTINNTIRRITPDGLVTTLAGAGPFSLTFADGTGQGAKFFYPCEIVADGAGNAFTVDWGNECVRKITPAGVVTTIAGDPGVPGDADGTGSSARFSQGPEGIAIDSSGNLYVSDSSNETIRKVTPSGVVTTIAGSPGLVGAVDGKGSAARFGYPIGLAVDSSGNVFVGDAGTYTIREIDPQSDVTTVSGTPSVIGNAPGTGASAQFNFPAGLALNAAGELFVAEPANNLVAVGHPASAQVASPPSAGTTVYAPFLVSTFAGKADSGSADGTASQASFGNASAVVSDGAGNLYVADTGNSVIRKISAAGTVSTLAGSAGTAGWRDGLGASALFQYPVAITLDAGGTVYVADLDNTIRKITAAGVVATLAGTAGAAGSADGVGAAARFSGPRGIAADGAGNVYVADSGNNTIRKISAAGAVTTLAGMASSLVDFSEGGAGDSDGQGSAARFDYPSGIAVDPSGNLYVTDQNNQTIRKVTSTGQVTTLAGDPGYSNFGASDGTGSSAQFYYPAGITMDANGSLLVADSYNDSIREVTPAGQVTTVATHVGFSDPSGLAGAARLMGPNSVTADGSGNLYVACWGGTAIRKIAPGGSLSVVAGASGLPGSSDGSGPAARFYDPAGVAIDGSGNLYVADTGNNSLRKVAPSGAVTTFAGNPATSGTTDGTGATALFESPAGLAVDGSGNVYVADEGACTVRKITPDGVVSTLAGLAGKAGYADGPNGLARFNGPAAVAVGPDGSVYVADEVNSAVRKIDGNGNVTTVAGTGGRPGSEDGPGSKALFCNPTGIACDSSGNLYVADLGNCTIRKVTPAGVVTTVAGTPGGAGPGDGAGSAARFTFPRAVAVDGSGNLYVSDTGSHTLRMINPAGVVTTLGGQPGAAGSEDGLGGAARFFAPAGLCVDASGNIYIADSGNRVIRKAVTQGLASGLSVVTRAPSSPVNAGTQVTLAVSGPGGQWQLNGASIPGAMGATYRPGSTSSGGTSTAAVGMRDSGDYSVREAGGAVLDLGTLTVTENAWLTNLSARALVGTGGNVLIGGFVTGGSSNKSVLLRANGPALSGVLSGALTLPQLSVYSGSAVVGSDNDGWSATLEAVMAGVGAAPWTVGSEDEALLESVSPGAYTGIESGDDNATGIGLFEIYDADAALGIMPGAPSNRLINISARAFVGTGANVLIGGFVIRGSTSMTVLIRGNGPSIANLDSSLTGLIAQPIVTLYDGGSNPIATNTGWGGAVALGTSTLVGSIEARPAAAADFQACGAFAWPIGSADSAIVATLPPGAYTVIESGVGGGTGIGLVEIYDLR